MPKALKLRTYLPGLVFLATLIAIGYVLESGLLQRPAVARTGSTARCAARACRASCSIVAVGGLVTAVAVPRHIVSFLGGYAFGVGLGTALALAATELGCVLVFFYGARRRPRRW